MKSSFNGSKRSRTFNVVFYGTALQLDKILLYHLDRIVRYAFITHDKDRYTEDITDDNGNVIHTKDELKKQHIHLLLDFYNAHTCTAVKKIFTTEEDKPRVECVSDKGAFYRYLTHKDEKNAYKYLDSEIITNDREYYEKVQRAGDKPDRDMIAERIVFDLLDDTDPRTMLNRYGRDYIIHKDKYKDMAEEIRAYRPRPKDKIPF